MHLMHHNKSANNALNSDLKRCITNKNIIKLLKAACKNVPKPVGMRNDRNDIMTSRATKPTPMV